MENKIKYSEFKNGKTHITYEEDSGGSKMNDKIIDKDLIIDSLKSKIKHEEEKINEANKQIEMSDKTIQACKDQINKLVQGE